MSHGDKARLVGAPLSIKNEIRAVKYRNTSLSAYNLGRNTNYSQIKICLGSEGIKLRHKDRKSLVRLLLLSGASLFSFFLSSFLLLAPFLKNFFLFFPPSNPFSLFFPGRTQAFYWRNHRSLHPF